MFTPEKNPTEYAVLKYARDSLMLVEASKLANLPKISSEEIDFLVIPQPQFKNTLNKDISLREVREVYLKYTFQRAAIQQSDYAQIARIFRI